MKLRDQSVQIDRWFLCFLRGCFDLSEVWLGIKGLLKPLRIDLAVFIQDMSIDLSDHVDLRMSRIILRCLQIAMIQLKLVCRAGMPKRMEHNVMKRFIKCFF